MPSTNTSSLPTILEEIVTARRGHLADIRARIGGVAASDLPPSTRSLYEALQGSHRFILECKSASPSLGMIRESYNPAEIARIYSRFGAAISVLCEPERFGGDYDHLATVAASTHLPVLCKDFIIDEVQVLAARYFGADAILLMLSVLDDATYSRLAACAESLGLDVLTEVLDEEEMARATALGARIIGVNHRNLHDLTIDLSRSAQLVPLAPEGAVLVAESGIRDHVSVEKLGGLVNGFLVGSQLTAQPDVDAAARALIYGENKVCGLTSPAAAQAACAAGAVYGGLITEPSSPRYVSRETSAAIMSAEPGLRYVAVSRQRSGYRELAERGVYAVQIHAPLSDTWEGERQLIASVRAEVGPDVKLWRAISMSEEHGARMAEAHASGGLVDALVLDNGEGGTGVSFDWTTIPDIVKDRALIAGGVSPANIEQALRTGCVGVDINSGVEYGPEAGETWQYRKNSAAIRSVFDSIKAFHFDPPTAAADPTKTTHRTDN
ncbi:Tryptophan biosynthesis protein TrpCF [Corynebacterium ciconiae DSM 44920]|uniref:bifunctional indole-3-glycerol-phosphate synthase TrpC/phosphoribosylanthranilate isomerase TrpF n=1 Tax=Corynebacterium ciconiae TaxID=227319 RepID=UPI0003702CC3|nr:bifunctional indole-3-glycerol-phosphate synthase TrpC/phosphoribosylanthranilate isomerase TrpF [Corynebacterium ciconiae]WKD62275.1 Tryptophan biosynthesis protein TrpCF [Corynebacterium ciconiae DSM 44920]